MMRTVTESNVLVVVIAEVVSLRGGESMHVDRHGVIGTEGGRRGYVTALRCCKERPYDG